MSLISLTFIDTSSRVFKNEIRYNPSYSRYLGVEREKNANSSLRGAFLVIRAQWIDFSMIRGRGQKTEHSNHNFWNIFIATLGCRKNFFFSELSRGVWILSRISKYGDFGVNGKNEHGTYGRITKYLAANCESKVASPFIRGKCQEKSRDAKFLQIRIPQLIRGVKIRKKECAGMSSHILKHFKTGKSSFSGYCLT